MKIYIKMSVTSLLIHGGSSITLNNDYILNSSCGLKLVSFPKVYDI